MASVKELHDRGSYWLIVFDDGGHDDVPKDPNVIDTAAANAAAIGQIAIANKLRAYAEHIRKDGKPVDVPMSTGAAIALVAALVGGANFLFRRSL